MNQSICSRLKSLLAPSGINVQTYLLNLTHGQAALVTSVEAGTSDPDVFMAIISKSDRNPAYFESARNHPSVPHILSWMTIDPSDISAPNVVHINYRDSIVWYLKGVLAAKMSTSNNFTMKRTCWTEHSITLSTPTSSSSRHASLIWGTRFMQARPPSSAKLSLMKRKNGAR
jgi:hypothetical protein